MSNRHIKKVFNQTTFEKNFTENLNGALETAIGSIKQLDLPKFGADLYLPTSTGVFYNADTILDATIAARVLDKFERPSSTAERELRNAAISGWIDLEESHVSRFNTRYLRGLPNWAGFLIAKARFSLSVTLRNFNNYLKDAPIDFGPGESYIANRGNTSFYDKLDAKLWTVTYDALQDFAFLVARNRGLWNCFKSSLNRELRSKTISRSCIYVGCNDKSQSIENKAIQVTNFLYHFDLVLQGGRGTSVYKNNEKRRFINIEPFGNIILQKFVGYAIRQCLNDIGINLQTGQDTHYNLIKYRVDTTDWKSASDIISNPLVEFLFPSSVNKLIQRYRSSFVELTYDIEGKRETVSHYPHKVSSMGNGFTFELLTLLNVTFSRLFDEKAVAYGDDVIITNGRTEEFVRIMTTLGFIINDKKSFINKTMRESCGGYYMDGFGYITCYDFKWNHDFLDSIITLNKIRRIYLAHPSSKVAYILYHSTEALRDRIPKAFKGPAVCDINLKGSSLPNWLEIDPHQAGRRLNDPAIRELFYNGQIILGPVFKVSSITTTGDFNYWVKSKVERKHYIAEKLRSYNEILPDTQYVKIPDYVERLQYDLRDFHIVKVIRSSPSIRVRKKNVVRDPRLFYTYLSQGHSNVTVRTRKDDRVLEYVWVLIDSRGQEHYTLV